MAEPERVNRPGDHLSTEDLHEQIVGTIAFVGGSLLSDVQVAALAQAVEAVVVERVVGPLVAAKAAEIERVRYERGAYRAEAGGFEADRADLIKRLDAAECRVAELTRERDLFKGNWEKAQSANTAILQRFAVSLPSDWRDQVFRIIEDYESARYFAEWLEACGAKDPEEPGRPVAQEAPAPAQLPDGQTAAKPLEKPCPQCSAQPWRPHQDDCPTLLAEESGEIGRAWAFQALTHVLQLALCRIASAAGGTWDKLGIGTDEQVLAQAAGVVRRIEELKQQAAGGDSQ